MLKRDKFLLATALLCITGLPLRGQDAPSSSPPSPKPEPEVSLFFAGGNFLGVRVEDVTRENMSGYDLSGEPRGVGVREVLKGGPAERAGLKERDVILRFDGETVASVRKLNRLIAESPSEHSARLIVRRKGADREIVVALGKRDAASLFDGERLRPQLDEWERKGEQLRERMEKRRRDEPELFALSFFGGRRIGVSTNTLGEQLAEYFGVESGVLITSVEEKSPAASAGLKAGDVVVEADGEKIEDSNDLSRAINRKKEGEVTLTVVRERKRTTVRVTPEKRDSPLFETSPGSFRIETPRIAISLPEVNIALPEIKIAPPPKLAPKMKAPAVGKII